MNDRGARLILRPAAYLCSITRCWVEGSVLERGYRPFLAHRTGGMQDPANELRRIDLLETVWKVRTGSISWSLEPARRAKGHPFWRSTLPTNARSDPSSYFPDSLSTHSGA